MGGLFGRRVCVVTLGCRSNHYEGEALLSMMEKEGAVCASEYDGDLDAAVVLTCSITGTADVKARKTLRRFRRRHPNAAIVGGGCFAQGAPAGLAEELGVDILVGNRLKHRIPEALARWFAGERTFVDLRQDIARSDSWDGLFLARPRLHTRAFVKVQDGCAQGCSYCVVPLVRGAPVSRDPDDTCREIEAIASSGTKEVVLTGVHLGDYDYRGLKLAGLIRLISRLSGVTRLRLGSIEPFGVSDDLLDALSSTGSFCPHLHLPLQSGDDDILARMRRGYDSRGFREIVARVRNALGNDAHLSTDLIVGFPGESERAFANSLDLLSAARFGKIHVFPFSAREGTDAAAFQDCVRPGVIRERTAAALALSERLLADYACGWVGREVSILVERDDDGILSGWTRHYVRACSRGGEEPVGCEASFVPRGSSGILLGEGLSTEMIRECYETI